MNESTACRAVYSKRQQARDAALAAQEELPDSFKAQEEMVNIQ